MRQPRKFILAALVAVCMLMLLTVMSGCRPSDALKEIIYDQTSEIVDYDNELKFLISNDQSEIEDETVPSEETTDTKEETDEKQNIVVYGSEPNSPDFTAKQSLWAMMPDFEGIEASAKVKFYESRDSNASKQRLKTDNPLDETDDSDDTSWDVEEGSELDDDKEGTAESPTSSNIEADASSSGGNGSSGNKDNVAVPEDGKTSGNVDIDLTGDYVDPPKVDSVAAYGDVAVLVQMIGGNGALAAADKTLLSGDFKKKVFTKASIKTGWGDDGETRAKIDTDAIIKSGAGALLVPSDSYLTEKQHKALKKGGVTVAQVYKMTNSKYIKKNADTIGEMLSDSKSIQYHGQTEDRASDYKDFFDGTIEACCDTANGGSKKLAGKQTYEKKNTAKYSYDTSAKYTLLIDDYDTSASYTKAIDGWKPSSSGDAKGAALSTVGYSTTPVSFYIQAGGLVNNAAYCGGSTSGQIIIWQFNSNIGAFNKGKWSFSSGGAVDKSINVTVNMAGAWDMSLLTSKYGTGGSEATDVSGASGNFGTDVFPKAIAATQQIKDKFIANSKDENSIYHPYGKAEGAWLNYCGVFTSGGSALYSTVGVTDNARTQLFDKGYISDDNVLVSPHGLFSSWTEGGSPESFLEAVWVNDVVNDDSGAIGWEKYVSDFYEEFYEYNLSSSELKTIEAGISK